MKVTARGDALKYLAYGNFILSKSDHKALVIMGSGASIERAVKVAEQLRQEIEALHQTTRVYSILVKKRAPPVVIEGVEPKEIMQSMACIDITLSPEEPEDKEAYGYQEPMPTEEFHKFKAERLAAQEKRRERKNRPPQEGDKERPRGGRGRGGRGVRRYNDTNFQERRGGNRINDGG